MEALSKDFKEFIKLLNKQKVEYLLVDLNDLENLE